MTVLGDYLAGISSKKGIWHCGEASGNLADTSGLSHTFTAAGTGRLYSQTALVPSDSTTTVNPGGAGYWTTPDHADFDIGTQNWWFFAALQSPANAVQFLFNKGDADGMEVYFDGDAWNCRGNGATIISAANSTEGWRNGTKFGLVLNVNRSGGSGQFYKLRTGTASASGSAAAVTNVANINNSLALELGTRQATGNSPAYYTGLVGYVAVGVGGVLTTQQINDLATILNTGTAPGGGGSSSGDPFGMMGFFGA
jgi:hypothetical protein